MTTGGWVFMLGSIGFVVALIVFCFSRVLSKPTSTDHMHAPIDMDTHDRNT